MSLILVLIIAAQAAATPTGTYRALGTGPSWSLTIADGQMVYESPGTLPISIAAPAPETGDGTITYRTRRLTVDIMHGPCEGPNDQRYTDAVFVTVGPDELSGCGGALLPADSLDGTSWHFAEIAGEAVELTGDLLRDDRYAIDFSTEAFVGYGGCNRFSARYSRSGNMLTAIAPFMSTRRACPEPAMSREQRLFQILSEPVRISFPDADTLVLTGNDGAIRLRRTRADYR